MRRFAAVLGLSAALLVAGIPVAVSALAYPTTHCAQLAVSATHVHSKENIEVSGSNFVASETVELYIGGHASVNGCSVSFSGGIHVGTAHTNSHGSFDPQVTVPSGLLGTEPVVGVGASGASNDIGVVNINISSSGAGGQSGGGSSGGGTAFTGVEVAALLTLAALLLVGGVAITRVGKRRSVSH